MPYMANISILMDVETEAEAMDCIAETMRPLMRNYATIPANTSIVDWMYNDADPEGTLLKTNPLPEGFVPDNTWPDVV